MSITPAMFVPGLALAGAVEGVLQAIHVEENTIKEIVSILEEYSAVIDESRPGTIRETAYGGSGTGESLGHHTKLAHDHVYKAMTTMMKTLSGTGERVKAYHKDMDFTDESNAGDFGSKVGRVVETVFHLPHTGDSSSTRGA
jgi:hypothetical protein